MTQPTALIAEDEPLLAQALLAELARAWPALHVVRTVGDGESAVEAALALRPDVLFFDIRMPGLSGLEAAAELADRWPPPGTEAAPPPFPALVFVTAYDHYALQAFEAQAMDYVLKPVQHDRLLKTVGKLQRALDASAPRTTTPDAALDSALAQLRGLLAQPAPSPTTAPLQVLQASVGNSIHLVPVSDVVYLEAADKYLRVLTAQQEYLLRTPLKELLPQLDSATFWQVHRSIVVRVAAVRTVQRDDSGRLTLQLHARSEKLPVSRLFAHRFKAM